MIYTYIHMICIYIYIIYLWSAWEFRPFTAMPGAPSSAAAKAALQKQQALQAQQEAAEAEQRRRAEAKALAQQDGGQQNGARNGGEMVDFYGFLWISMDFCDFSVASCGFGHSLSLEMVGFGWYFDDFWWIFCLDYLTKNVKLWDGGCLILFNDFSTKTGFSQWCDL